MARTKWEWESFDLSFTSDEVDHVEARVDVSLSGEVLVDLGEAGKHEIWAALSEEDVEADFVHHVGLAVTAEAMCITMNNMEAPMALAYQMLYYLHEEDGMTLAEAIDALRVEWARLALLKIASE